MRFHRRVRAPARTRESSIVDHHDAAEINGAVRRHQAHRLARLRQRHHQALVRRMKKAEQLVEPDGHDSVALPRSLASPRVNDGVRQRTE